MRKQLIIILTILVASCSNNSIYRDVKTVKNNRWHKDSIINFTFSPEDTLSKNNIYINLRNNNDYEYSNLFLIVNIDFPDNQTVVDTLEYEMADAEGRFLGDGLTDLKENKLEYKQSVIFPKTGNYNINIQQAMRKNGTVNGIEYLSGITDVGISIEKVN